MGSLVVELRALRHALCALGRYAQGCAVVSRFRSWPSTESQGERWRDLVKDVRKVYRGKLLVLGSARARCRGLASGMPSTSSASPDNQKSIAVVNGTDEDLRKAMAPCVSRRLRWLGARRGRKRYLFTDLGLFTANTRSARHADGRATTPAHGIRGLAGRPARLEGVLAGAWIGRAPQQPLPGVRERPAAEVLRHWYRASRVAAQGSILP